MGEVTTGGKNTALLEQGVKTSFELLLKIVCLGPLKSTTLLSNDAKVFLCGTCVMTSTHHLFKLASFWQRQTCHIKDLTTVILWSESAGNLWRNAALWIVKLNWNTQISVRWVMVMQVFAYNKHIHPNPNLKITKGMDSHFSHISVRSSCQIQCDKHKTTFWRLCVYYYMWPVCTNTAAFAIYLS